jgi:two-component system, LuxR family, sensor histidine kinase TtrS
MKFSKISILCILFILLSWTCAIGEIKIGILAQRGTEKAMEEWGPLGEYLTKELGEQVTIIPVKFSNFRDWCASEPTAYFITNSWFYVRAKIANKAKALATTKYKGQNPLFGGVIFVRKDSGITKLDEIKGKTLICPKFSSLGGWLFQKGVLVKEGITPEKDLKHLMETPDESQDTVVASVLERKADVGCVRTNLLEAMQREKKLNLEDITVLNPMHHEDFAQLCSTPLYPDWPFAAMGGVPADQAAKVKQTLLAIPPNHPVLVKARGVEQFIDALDYSSVEELCRFLKVPPFQR